MTATTTPLEDPAHVAEVWALVRRLGAAADPAGAVRDPDAPPAVDRTSLGVTIAVGPAGPGRWHVSLSHAERDVRALPHAVGAVEIHTERAATHCTVSARTAPPWLDPDYFVR